MVHELKLYSDNFDKLEKGLKTREYRLYDEKRKLINIGDTIKFVRLPDLDRYLYVDVINIEVFNNWFDCYEKYFDDFKDRYKTIQDVVDDTYNNYYTKEDSDKYGCCCLTLSKVRKNK